MLDVNPLTTSERHAEAYAEPWPSIGAALEDRATKTPTHIGYSYPDAQEEWQRLSWLKFRDIVHQFASGLADLGVQPGDRVAIVAGTSIQWLIADFAICCLGAITTTIYPNASADDYAYILKDSGASFVVAQNQKIIDKLTAAGCDEIRTIIAIEDTGLQASAKVVRWADVDARGRGFALEHPSYVLDAIAQTNHETISTYMYTSGTTGNPKGVVIDHGAWIYSGIAWGYDVVEHGDVHLLWLPMSHAFGKCLVMVGVFADAEFAVDGRPERIFDNMAAVRPTIMCGVPRIFEKVRAAAITSSRKGGMKDRIAQWAFHIGSEAYPYRIENKPMPPKLRAQFAVADKLVFAKLRDKFGGRLRFMISGSAKLSPQVQKWFYSAGIPVYEGYGITEACAVDFFSATRFQFGTVGPVSPGGWVKIDDDGEVLYKSPAVMRGYLNNPELTAEVLMEDGFIRTGDIGHLNEDGLLVITDRKKDLIKTSNGKYIAPSDVEASIMANCPYAAQVLVAGEGRKYAVALIELDRPGLEKWAAKRKIAKSYAELTQLPEIHASIQRFVDRANSHLGQWETVKKFAILDHQLTLENGDLTPNMKLRRRAVLADHADLIDALYGDDETPAA